MLNRKESIISIILGAFILFLAIGIGSISGTITGSGLTAILLGIIFILKPIVCRRVHSGTIDNAWLFYTNEDGDYKGECIAIRDEDLELLQSILPTKAWLEANVFINRQIAGFEIEDMAKYGFDPAGRYEIRDYENGMISFNCQEVIIKNVRRWKAQL